MKALKYCYKLQFYLAVLIFLQYLQKELGNWLYMQNELED
jgi:hypothetical protein